MSAVSSVYDAFYSIVPTVLTTHSLLINPFVPEMNDDLTYDVAWGLVPGSGTDPQTELECRLYEDKTFTIVLTRKLRIGDLMRGSDAFTARKTKEKALLEDAFLLKKKFAQDVTLGGVCVNCKLETDNGIEFVRSEQFDLIMIKLNFVVKYVDDITV